MHYSTRPNSGPGQILKGDDLFSDLPLQKPDAQLLGQIDQMEAGVLSGWACSKGQLLKPLEVISPGKRGPKRMPFTKPLSPNPTPSSQRTQPCLVRQPCLFPLYILTLLSGFSISPLNLCLALLCSARNSWRLPGFGNARKNVCIRQLVAYYFPQGLPVKP